MNQSDSIYLSTIELLMERGQTVTRWY